ncbi:MAG: hypothetical protein AAF903_12045 [Pseudomonadota bacterium]
MIDKATNFVRRAGVQFEHPVKAATKIPKGAITMLQAGMAVNAIAAANLVSAGICTHSVDNSTGADGDKRAPTEKGCFVLRNSSTAPVTRAHIGQDCYAEDNEFVTIDAAGKSKVGKIVDVDASGVSVQI